MHAGKPPHRWQSLKPRGIWGGGVHRASYVAASHQLRWEANAASERELNLGEAGSRSGPPVESPYSGPLGPCNPEGEVPALLPGSACGARPKSQGWGADSPGWQPLAGSSPVPTEGAASWGGGQPLSPEAGGARWCHPQRTQGLGLQPHGDPGKTLGPALLTLSVPWNDAAKSDTRRVWAPVQGFSRGVTGAAPSPGGEGLPPGPGAKGRHRVAGASPSPSPGPHGPPGPLASRYLLPQTWEQSCLLLARRLRSCSPGPGGHGQPPPTTRPQHESQ